MWAGGRKRRIRRMFVRFKTQSNVWTRWKIMWKICVIYTKSYYIIFRNSITNWTVTKYCATNFYKIWPRRNMYFLLRVRFVPNSMSTKKTTFLVLPFYFPPVRVHSANCNLYSDKRVSLVPEQMLSWYPNSTLLCSAWFTSSPPDGNFKFVAPTQPVKPPSPPTPKKLL
jgi:hypothetical protein